MSSSKNSKKQKQENQHPNWVFTLQYGGEGQITLEDAGVLVQGLEKYCSYLIAGKESAPTTGQLHMQGYVQLLKPRRRTELVKVIPCFWEPARESASTNHAYCSKGGDFYEVGEAKEEDPGKREQDRWDTARAQAEAGERVTDSQIVICHYASLRLLSRDHMVMPPSLEDVCGIWLYGIAGAGKSRKARHDYEGAYLKMCNKWWDGYQGQTYVIMDDFDVSHAALGHHLKIWADRYPFTMEVKGGAMAIRPTVFCVTSQYEIDEIWPDVQTREALHRRFKSVRIGPHPDTPRPMKAMLMQLPGDETDDEDQSLEQTPPSGFLKKMTRTTSCSSIRECTTEGTSSVSVCTAPTTTVPDGPISMNVNKSEIVLPSTSALRTFLKEHAEKNPVQKSPDVQEGFPLKRSNGFFG